MSKQSAANDMPKVEFEDIISGEGRLNKDISVKFDRRKGTEFKPNDILFGKLRPYLKNWLFPNFAGVALGDFWVLRAQDVAPIFLYYLIQTVGYMEVANLSVGTKMPRSNWTTVSGAEFGAPPQLEEQEQIGVLLTTLDEIIALRKRKLALLRQMKAALLQRLFPLPGTALPRLRSAGCTDLWHTKSLGLISSKVNQKNVANKYDETFSNTALFGIISQRDYFDKDISNSANLSTYYIVQPDDFVYNPRISQSAPVGPIKRNKLNRTGVMSPLYYIFRVRGVDLSFLESYFQCANWHNFMRQNGDNGVRADRFNIKDSTFEQMPIPLPTQPEQAGIGELFRKIDDLISQQQLLNDNLATSKNTLIQLMFI